MILIFENHARHGTTASLFFLLDEGVILNKELIYNTNSSLMRNIINIGNTELIEILFHQLKEIDLLTSKDLNIFHALLERIPRNIKKDDPFYKLATAFIKMQKFSGSCMAHRRRIIAILSIGIASRVFVTKAPAQPWI